MAKVAIIESVEHKIMRKSGRKLTQCNCKKCQSQCKSPCLGTPKDILNIIKAGYKDKVVVTYWAAGMVMGVINRPIPMVQPLFNEETGYCVFFKDGLCELHDKKLKPIEGKLSHHSLKVDNFNPKKSLSWLVAKEWISDSNLDIVEEITLRLVVDESISQTNLEELINEFKSNKRESLL